MIYTIYAQKDATIYERTESLNTGIDEVLELSHTTVGTSSRYNSRILLKVDVKYLQMQNIIYS